jgi:hypothetical protein
LIIGAGLVEAGAAAGAFGGSPIPYDLALEITQVASPRQGIAH